MTSEVSIKLFKYDELGESAKEVARGWYRQFVFQDSCDWEHAQDDACNVAAILGIDIKMRTYETRSGKTRKEPCIFFQLAYCQGDGASFDGTYRYNKGATKKIREYCNDEELFRIADELQRIQAANFYSLVAEVTERDMWINVSVVDSRNPYRDVSGAEREIADLLRDFCRWHYKQLEAEYEYQTSDQAIEEAILANEYDFEEDGSRWRQ